MKKGVIIAISLIACLTSCRKSARNELFLPYASMGRLESGFSLPKHAEGVLKLNDNAIGIYFEISPEFESEYLSQLDRLKLSADLPPAVITLKEGGLFDNFKNISRILVRDSPAESTYEALIVSDNTSLNGKQSVYYTYWRN